MIAEFHELLSVCKVQVQPAGSTAVNAKLAFEMADEDVMVDGIYTMCIKLMFGDKNNVSMRHVST